MTPKFLPHCRLLVFSLGLGTLWLACGLAQEKPTAPPGQAPARAKVQSNEAQSAPKKTDALKDMEQSLFKPFQSFSPQGSLEPISPQINTPPQPSVQNKHTKD